MLDVRTQVPLLPLTTFQIGGPAGHFAEVRTEAEIGEAVQWAKDNAIRLVVIAGGSNVLIPDGGIDGFVTRIAEGGHAFDGAVLTADAGCTLLTLIRQASKRGFGGWEKLAGIPGSIGGAIRGNAGAFGTEIKDVAASVRALHRETGEARDFNTAECDFSYRHSYFKDNPDWIITSVMLTLAPADSAGSAALIEETILERERRHLQNVRAAGSFFMNPVAPRELQEVFEREKGVTSKGGRVPAGWLIEKVGLKGHRVGDAVASEQHPNYLVNAGNATAHDVGNLAQLIKLEVFAQFGVELEEEASLL